MSYRLTFSTDKELFSFRGMKQTGDAQLFESPSILNYIKVRGIYYKGNELVSEREGILYPGFPVECIYLKNGLLYFVPEETPVNVVYTYAL
jgi:hypothetical protein